MVFTSLQKVHILFKDSHNQTATIAASQAAVPFSMLKLSVDNTTVEHVFLHHLLNNALVYGSVRQMCLNETYWNKENKARLLIVFKYVTFFYKVS